MQQIESSEQNYQDNNCLLNFFMEQSENCEIIIGKVSLTPKRQIGSQTLHISLRGYYIVTKVKQVDIQLGKQLRQDSEYSINTYDSGIDKVTKLESFQNIATFSTNRSKITNTEQSLENSHKKLISAFQGGDSSDPTAENQRVTCFLEGKKKISQLENRETFDAWQMFVFPFTFNLPESLPPSFESITFGAHQIQIRYEIQVTNSQKSKDITISAVFPIKLRVFTKELQESNKAVAIKFQCFRCLCRCEGNYHFEFQTSVLTPGKLRVYARIFREGGAVQKIVKSMRVKFFGQMKKVRKILLEDKEMKVSQNDFEMLEGQIILGYDKGLRSLDNQLFTIRFWIQPSIEFVPGIWIFNQKSIKNDIIL